MDHARAGVFLPGAAPATWPAVPTITAGAPLDLRCHPVGGRNITFDCISRYMFYFMAPHALACGYHCARSRHSSPTPVWWLLPDNVPSAHAGARSRNTHRTAVSATAACAQQSVTFNGEERGLVAVESRALQRGRQVDHGQICCDVDSVFA
eukprot:364604-Chlamydomonas_euryale.AAC.15